MAKVPVSHDPSKKPAHFPHPAASAPPAPPNDPFVVFYRRHWSFVRSFVQSLNVRALYLDDITQEVFLVCHQRDVFPSSEGEARAWLTACAFRIASNHRRRKYVRVESSYDDSHAPALAPRWDEELDAIRLISGALAQLDPTHRAVFLSAYVEEVPLSKIGVRHGMKPKRLTATLCEAQKGMKFWIRRRFLRH